MRIKTPRTGIWLFVCLVSINILSGCAQNNIQSSVFVTEDTARPKLIVWPNRNSHSQDEVAIRLVVKAGSLQETDDQQGYAHFVEHMVFRGTENFPGKTLQARLRELGVDIGQHSNAYTSFNETVYWMHLNTADQDRIDGVLEVLADMAFNATFDPTAVDVERSVVLQELRDHARDEDRVENRLFEHFYQGSQYAERRPIGTVESITSATGESLKAFYDHWYHTGNMTVVVAGDVDRTAIDATLARVFPAKTEKSEGGTPETVPLNVDAISERFILTDPFTTSGAVWMSYLHTAEPPSGETDWLNLVALWAGLDILYDRFQARLLDWEGRVSDVDLYWTYPVPGYFSIEFGGYFAGNNAESALLFLEEERQRLLIDGITAEELSRWQTNFLRNERRQQDSAEHLANEAVQHVLEGFPLLNQPEKLALWEAAVLGFTPDHVVNVLRPTLTQAPKIAVVHPYGVAAPTTLAVDDWLNSVSYMPNTNRVQQTNNDDWPIEPTYLGGIAQEENLGHGLTRWQLDNGIEVFHYFNNANPDKVNFTMVGLGGFNRLADEDVIAGRMLMDIMGSSGLRELDGPELSRWIENHNLALDIQQDYFDKVLFGSSETDNLDVALRVVHSALTEARVDPRVWHYFYQQYSDHIEQSATHPHKSWHDMVTRELLQNDTALRAFTLDDLHQVTPEQLVDIYQSTVAGAQNYRLAIVGDISLEAARAAVLESIATLAPHPELIPAGRTVPRVQAPSDERIEGSGEQSAHIVLRYNLPKTGLADSYGSDSHYLSRWLNERLFDRLRNELGEVYSVQGHVEGNTERHVDVALVINLSVPPEKVDHAIKEVQTTLAAAHGTLSPEELSRWYREGRDGLRNEQLSPNVLANDIAYAELLEYDVVRLVTADPRVPEAANVERLLALFLFADAIPQTWVWLP